MSGRELSSLKWRPHTSLAQSGSEFWIDSITLPVGAIGKLPTNQASVCQALCYIITSPLLCLPCPMVSSLLFSQDSLSVLFAGSVWIREKTGVLSL